MTVTNVATMCPVCQQAHNSAASICPHCGLVFTSVTAEGASIVPATGAAFTLAIPTPSLLIPAPLQPGQSLSHGRFTVLRPLSQGGMGELYLALDHCAFDRSVVLTTLLADPTASPAEQLAAQLRFAEEARTLSTLHYPTIPQIFAYVQEGTQQCIVMEYIEGRDLSQNLSHRDGQGQRVAGKPYPIRDVIRWGVSMARILVYLASQQPPVVHQDIKPANLILHQHSGDLYLVDFGAARTKQVMQPTGGKTTIFGTHGYAAPEQYQGQSEARSDVYALAATLYHLATDEDPAESPFAFPRLKYMGYLGMLLGFALKPDPNERPTAQEFYTQLTSLLTPEGTRILSTPDGMLVENETDLATWCETHWDAGEVWLTTTLPDDVQLIWLRPNLAEKLRACRNQHPGEPAAALDAALALLDPQGYRLAPPMLTVNPPRLDLGAFPVSTTQSGHSSFTLTNQGRRFLYLELHPPEWIEVSVKVVRLRPGRSIHINLLIDRFAPVQGSDPWRIDIKQRDMVLQDYEVQGRPYWQGTEPSAEDVRQGLIVVGVTWAVLLVLTACVCLLFILWAGL